jgi:hypothetical protein
MTLDDWTKVHTIFTFDLTVNSEAFNEQFHPVPLIGKSRLFFSQKNLTNYFFFNFSKLQIWLQL